MDEPDKRSPDADDAEYREMHIPHLLAPGYSGPAPTCLGLWRQGEVSYGKNKGVN